MKKKILPGIFTILFILFSVSLVSAATPRYVNTATGSDDSGCAVLADPCKTIQYAINQAVAGDTVSVAAGTYDEQVIVNKSLTLQGAGDTTIIKPSSASKLTVVLDGLFWYGTPNTKQIAGIIVANVSDGSNVIIKNLKVDESSIATKPAGADYLTGIFYRETGGTVEGVSNVGTGSWSGSDRAYGMYLSAATNAVTVEVKGSSISNWDKNGIEVMGSILTANIHNNTLTGRGYTGSGDEVPNGVSVARGALATVNYNTITYLGYNPQTWLSAGIMLSTANGLSWVEGNNVSDCQLGIVFNNNGGSIIGNTVTGGKVGIVFQKSSLFGAGSWTANLENNNISGCWGYGIEIWSAADSSLDATMTGNQLSGGDGDGIDIEGSGGSIIATITDNTILDWTHGIYFDGSLSAVSLNVNITGNTIQNNVGSDSGIHVEPAVDVTNIHINFNKITGNSGRDVYNGASGILDATKNWWGSINPNFALILAGNVDYSPWLGKVPGSSPMTWYTNDKIQDAIDAASSDDTIKVISGTYTEDLTILATKANLEIRPDVGASVTIKGVTNVPIASWPLALPNIEILADGAKIHGFTIQSPTYESGKYTSGIIVGAKNVEIYSNTFVMNSGGGATNDEISQAIQTYRTGSIPSADSSGLNIHDNTFTSTGVGAWGYEGIYLNPDAVTGTITIQNNAFSGKIFRAITTERSKTTIAENTIYTDLAPGPSITSPGGWQGINVYNYDAAAQSDVTVSSNTVTGSDSGKGFNQGIRIGKDSSQILTNFNVNGNKVQYNTNGILVKSASGVIITANTIVDNAIGVKNDDTVLLNAEKNWWGDDTGPYDLVGTTEVPPCTSNPSTEKNADGLGNDVIGNVDYCPWLPLKLTLISPESKAYDTKNILVNVSAAVKVDKIEYSLDGSSFRTLCSNCDGYDREKSFREGPHVLVVKATLDDITSPEESVNFFVDSVEPKIIKTLPEDGAIIHGTQFYIKYTEDNLQNISLYWKESPQSIPQRITNTSCQSGSYKECTFDLNLNSFNGQYINYFFEVRDLANSVNSSVRTIKIDSTIPAVTINLPENNTFYSDTRIGLDVGVTDTVKMLEYSVDGGNFQRLCRDCSGYADEKTFTNGPHTLTVRATDYAGNIGYGFVSFTIDSRAPKIIKQLPRDKKYTNGTFTITYTEENLKKITLFYKGASEDWKNQPSTSCPAGKNKECNFYVDLTSYNGQQINYYFVAENHLLTSTSKTYTENVDTTVPEFTIASPTPGDYSRRVLLKITGVTEDVKLEYSDKGGTFRTLCSSCNSYENSKTFSDGPHTLLVRATDEAGNTRQHSVSFTV